MRKGSWEYDRGLPNYGSYRIQFLVQHERDILTELELLQKEKRIFQEAARSLLLERVTAPYSWAFWNDVKEFLHY